MLSMVLILGSRDPPGDVLTGDGDIATGMDLVPVLGALTHKKSSSFY